ncbi:MAG: hypothetical protein HQ530_05700 [Parcubacteria group bacterium]|nr:hypothetical protein [Parcubacteria group bacterium]
MNRRENREKQVTIEWPKVREFHTVVLHHWFDVEALASYLLVVMGCILGLSLTADHKIKIIPAGPLRKEDWGNLGTNVQQLEDMGYLFLDCGGGFLDHHGKKLGLCTLELLAKAIGLVEGYEYLLGAVNVIADQDKTGQALDSDPGFQMSSTPNTPRTLRSLITGWNLQCFVDGQLRPEQVIQLASKALEGVFALVHTSSQATNDKTPRVKGKGHFILDRLLAGLRLQKMPTAEREEFTQSAKDALFRMENEWRQAAADFKGAMVGEFKACAGPAKFQLLTGPVDYRDGSWMEADGQILFFFGQSRSYRFGSYCRWMASQKGKNEELTAHDGQPLTECDVVILQHWDDEHFNVSTGRWEKKRDPLEPRLQMILTDVCAALRAADAIYRGATIQAQLLDQIGNVSYYWTEKGDGQSKRRKDLSPIFLPEWQGSTGDKFNTNPYRPPPSVTRENVVAIIWRVLQGLPIGHPKSDCKKVGDAQPHDCPWRQFSKGLAGCHEKCENWRPRKQQPRRLQPPRRSRPQDKKLPRGKEVEVPKR